MGEWTRCKLGDLVRIKHGFAFKSDNFVEDGANLPIVVAVGNFRYEGGFRFAETAVKRYDGEYPPEFALSPQDILLIMTCQTAGGEILGVPARVPEDGRLYLHNQRLGKVVINDNSQVDAGYLYQLFKWARFNRHLYVTASGSKILHTAPSRIESFEFDLPPIDAQRVIAGVLGALDDKIEQNRRTARALEGLARAIFRAWFVDFEPVQAKAAGASSFPSMPQAAFDALPTRLVESAIGPVPEGWEVKALGDISEINARSVRKGEIDGEIEYVDIASVSVGQLDEVQRVAFAEAPSRARRRIQHGDTIWSCVRPNRRSYLFIHSPPSERIVSTGFAVLSPTGVGPAFLYQTVTQSEFVDYLVSNADGSAYPAVRAEHFAAAEVLVPPDPLVKVFEDIAMPMRDWIAQADTESRMLAELRDLLLPKLLSGAVRVGEAGALV